MTAVVKGPEICQEAVSSRKQDLTQRALGHYIQFEIELTAFAFGTGKTQVCTHQVEQFFTDGQTQSGTAVFAADGVVCL